VRHPRQGDYCSRGTFLDLLQQRIQLMEILSKKVAEDMYGGRSWVRLLLKPNFGSGGQRCCSRKCGGEQESVKGYGHVSFSRTTS
jgi:hypothetical protein